MLKKTHKIFGSIVFIICSLFISNSYAVGQGDWLVRFGAVHVSPNDSSGTLSLAPTVGVAVDSDTQVFANLTYMLKSNIGIELLAATPFSHTLSATGGLSGDIAKVKQLPPTLSVQYHFSPNKSFRPYVGGGINYTTFFDEEPIAGTVITSISLDDSWGLAVQAGFDMDISSSWFANIDLRYISITTTATTNLGTIDVDIDPWVLSIGVGTTF